MVVANARDDAVDAKPPPGIEVDGEHPDLALVVDEGERRIRGRAQVEAARDLHAALVRAADETGRPDPQRCPGPPARVEEGYRDRPLQREERARGRREEVADDRAVSHGAGALAGALLY